MDSHMITGTAAYLWEDNIDTDQIIPARFLKTTSKNGLGDYLFYDRKNFRNQRPNMKFPLNSPQNRKANLLISGSNFGCGSSREHAIWALQDFGFEAILAPSFADIFYSNALLSGLLLVTVRRDFLYKCLQNEVRQIEIDFNQQTLNSFQICEHEPIGLNAFGRELLLHKMDPMDYLLQYQNKISDFETKRSL